MNVSTHANWHPALLDPSGKRQGKPRTCGITMVIDKGMGNTEFTDLLYTSGEYLDMIKIGFGTSPLYPRDLLRKKIKLAVENGIGIMPGGTFLEAAVYNGAVDAFFESAHDLGFTAIEVSDGTIELSRQERNRIILRAVKEGFRVFTEYGKKLRKAEFEVTALADTVHIDIEYGAEMVIVEGRESGKGVGIYNEQGECRDEVILRALDLIENPEYLMWEAPRKEQQVHLLKMLGRDVNLGNIAPSDLLSVESLRRGLRSDTFCFRKAD
ncbi:MAG TPA: phosphosulfolactate synthase [Bacilli bacterium]